MITTVHPARKVAFLALLLLLGTTAQCVWGYPMRFHGARPDFVLLFALLCSQFCPANEAAAVGFSAGMLSACVASPPDGGLGSIVFSLTLICFSIGWLEGRVFRDNPAMALAIVAAGTVLTQSAFFAVDPQHHALSWARGVLLEVIYNLILALPVYLIVRACLRVKKPFTPGPVVA